MQPTSRGRVRVESSPKRVRGFSGGALVFDTTSALLVWEGPHYPQYHIPRSDVDAELVPTGGIQRSPSRGDAAVVTLRKDGHEVPDAGWLFDDSPIDALNGHVRFRWDALDAWFEEDVEVFTHPRSPYVRVDILPTSRHVRVEVDGITVAESDRARILFETGLRPRYYVPLTDVRMDLLEASARVTHCPYKGSATYWSVAVPGRERHEDLIWTYRSPFPESAGIAGLVAFYDERADVFIDEVRVPH